MVQNAPSCSLTIRYGEWRRAVAINLAMQMKHAVWNPFRYIRLL